MATIFPTHTAAIRNLLKPGLVGGAELDLRRARFVLQIHDSYARPPFPDRPGFLKLEDHELIDAYREYHTGVQLGADKRRQLGYFGKWRASVFAAEAKAGSAMSMLVEAARVFEAHEHADEADALWDFACNEYPELRREDVPDFDLSRPYFRAALVNWCMQTAKDYFLLPRHMRLMQHPRDAPKAKPAGREDETEGQKGFGWDR